jgi:hypothetical protein
MQQNITTVINSVLAEEGLQHEPRAQRVVEKVATRLSEALASGVDSVVDAAVSEGINEGVARQAFVDAGLAEVPAPVAPADTSGLSELTRKVNALCDLARTRLGVTI